MACNHGWNDTKCAEHHATNTKMGTGPIIASVPTHRCIGRKKAKLFYGATIVWLAPFFLWKRTADGHR